MYQEIKKPAINSEGLCETPKYMVEATKAPQTSTDRKAILHSR
jgi:hypothetical protein